MLELSILADESGDKSDHAKYYLLTLVFHNQADSIIDLVMTYERSLADADLPNISLCRACLPSACGSQGAGLLYSAPQESAARLLGISDGLVPACGPIAVMR